MDEEFKVNPTLVKRLLTSDISSREIASSTGLNLQEINSYREKSDGQEPLLDLADMRLKLASSLTKAAKDFKIRSHDTAFLTKEKICDALHHPVLEKETVKKEMDVTPLVLKIAKKYAKKDTTIGIIRLGVVMEVLDTLDQVS